MIHASTIVQNYEFLVGAVMQYKQTTYILYTTLSAWTYTGSFMGSWILHNLQMELGSNA